MSKDLTEKWNDLMVKFTNKVEDHINENRKTFYQTLILINTGTFLVCFEFISSFKPQLSIFDKNLLKTAWLFLTISLMTNLAIFPLAVKRDEQNISFFRSLIGKPTRHIDEKKINAKYKIPLIILTNLAIFGTIVGVSFVVLFCFKKI